MLEGDSNSSSFKSLIGNIITCITITTTITGRMGTGNLIMIITICSSSSSGTI